MKALPLTKCSQCKFWHTSPFPTPDSFERPEYWWCSNPDVHETSLEDETDEHRRVFEKNDRKFKKLRKIQGYVETFDKVDIPGWCPLPEIPE